MTPRLRRALFLANPFASFASFAALGREWEQDDRRVNPASWAPSPNYAKRHARGGLRPLRLRTRPRREMPF